MSKFYLIVIAIFSLSNSGLALGKNPSKLDRIFDPEMINADIAYFERVTGPARNTYGQSKVYKTNGCEITVFMSSGTIRSLHMQLSDKCTFDLSKFISNKFPPLYKMTFGQFFSNVSSVGQFYADCLSNCGNTLNPIVYSYWQGPRSENFLEVMLEVAQDSDAAINAAGKWVAAMKKEQSDDWIIDGKFNCFPKKYNKYAQDAFRDVKINAITLGYDILSETEDYSFLTFGCDKR